MMLVITVMLEPLIIDPKSFDKQDAYNDAVVFCRGFLKMNDIKPPIFFSDMSTFASRYKQHYGVYFFDKKFVFVNLPKSRNPTVNPGWSWDYSGYRYDSTPAGCVAHEIGHHVDNMLGEVSKSSAMRKLRKHEPPITQKCHEYDRYEVFAESIRLFVLNPDLLRRARPLRWKFLTEHCGLVPPHDAHWREIMKNSHEKHRIATSRWIKKSL